jgi:hypothetical protein
MRTFKVKSVIIGKKIPVMVTRTDDELAENDYGHLEDTLVFELAMKGQAPLKIERALKCCISDRTTQIALKCKSVYIGKSRAMRLYKAQLIMEVENVPDKLSQEQISKIFDMQPIPLETKSSVLDI